MASIIIDRIPQHKTYAEVFGGAAWVLFRKEPSPLEVLNDLDSHLMNFYRVTKYHLKALIEEVSCLQPSRDLFYYLRQELERPAMTDIQRAASYFYIQRQAFAGRPKMPTLGTGPGRRIGCRRLVAEKILPKAAERLQEVMLENLHWERFIKLYDSTETFFFIDPPYIGHTEYRHNFKQADFESLAAALKSLKGHFLMTHTDSPAIRALFKGFNFEEIEIAYTTSHISQNKKHKVGKEVLISNY